MFSSILLGPSPDTGTSLDFYGASGTDIRLSDIFEIGGALLYAGSNFQIQESLAVSFIIDEPKYVDTDFRYYTPKHRLGFWQLNGGLSSTWVAEESGELNYLVTQFDRYHDYTVTSNPDEIYLTGADISISDCNFVTQDFEVSFGGLTYSQAALQIKQDVFRGTIYDRAVPLQDKIFTPKLSGMGIRLVPGVSFVSAVYQIRPINFAYNDSLPAPVRTCTTSGPSCSDEFANFIATTSNVYANFSDLPPTSQVPGNYGTDTWVSPDIADCNFPYWYVAQN